MRDASRAAEICKKKHLSSAARVKAAHHSLFSARTIPDAPHQPARITVTPLVATYFLATRGRTRKQALFERFASASVAISAPARVFAIELRRGRPRLPVEPRPLHWARLPCAYVPTMKLFIKEK